MEGGPPIFKQDFSCPVLLSHPRKTVGYRAITLSRRASQLSSPGLSFDDWPLPLSLTTTHGVSFDVLSSGY